MHWLATKTKTEIQVGISKISCLYLFSHVWARRQVNNMLSQCCGDFTQICYFTYIKGVYRKLWDIVYTSSPLLSSKIRTIRPPLLNFPKSHSFNLLEMLVGKWKSVFVPKNRRPLNNQKYYIFSFFLPETNNLLLSDIQFRREACCWFL